MEIDLVGLFLVLALYVLILAVGIITAYKFKKKNSKDESGVSNFTDTSMVAGRDLGLVVGIFTMSGIIFVCIFH